MTYMYMYEGGKSLEPKDLPAIDICIFWEEDVAPSPEPITVTYYNKNPKTFSILSMTLPIQIINGSVLG